MECRGLSAWHIVLLLCSAASARFLRDAKNETISNQGTCYYNGTWFMEKEELPTRGLCLICHCFPGFTEPNAFTCSVIDCPWEDYHRRFPGCTPIYADRDCCPIGWECDYGTQNPVQQLSKDPQCDCEWRYLKHYEAKGCRPVYEEKPLSGKPSCTCPWRFDCSQADEIHADDRVCVYKKHVYPVGKKIETSNPCESCSCVTDYFTQAATISCTTTECPSVYSQTPLPEGCHYVYKENECCPTRVECPAAQKDNEYKIPTCEYKSKMYYEGEQIYPDEDPCLICLCNQNWTGINSTSCRQHDCMLERDSRKLKQGCIPIYHEKTCCPIDYHCADDDFDFKGNRGPSFKSDDDEDEMCFFESRYYPIGHVLDIKHPTNCVTCTCKTPPDFTCIHSSCPPPPNNDYTNCRAIYKPNSCCPDYTCEEKTSKTCPDPICKGTNCWLVKQDDGCHICRCKSRCVPCPPMCQPENPDNECSGCICQINSTTLLDFENAKNTEVNETQQENSLQQLIQECKKMQCPSDERCMLVEEKCENEPCLPTPKCEKVAFGCGQQSCPEGCEEIGSYESSCPLCYCKAQNDASQYKLTCRVQSCEENCVLTGRDEGGCPICKCPQGNLEERACANSPCRGYNCTMAVNSLGCAECRCQLSCKPKECPAGCDMDLDVPENSGLECGCQCKNSSTAMEYIRSKAIPEKCAPVSCQGLNCTIGDDASGCPFCICKSPCPALECQEGCQVEKEVAEVGRCPRCVCKLSRSERDNAVKECPPPTCLGYNCSVITGEDGCQKCLCESPCEENPQCPSHCELEKTVPEGRCRGCVCSYGENSDTEGKPSHDDEKASDGTEEDGELEKREDLEADFIPLPSKELVPSVDKIFLIHGDHDPDQYAGVPGYHYDGGHAYPVFGEHLESALYNTEDHVPEEAESDQPEESREEHFNHENNEDRLAGNYGSEGEENSFEPEYAEEKTIEDDEDEKCAQKDCPEGQKCVIRRLQCIRTPCPTIPVCIDVEPRCPIPMCAIGCMVMKWDDEVCPSCFCGIIRGAEGRVCPRTRCLGRRCYNVIGDDGCPVCKCDSICIPPKCSDGCWVESDPPEGKCPTCTCPQRSTIMQPIIPGTSPANNTTGPLVESGSDNEILEDSIEDSEEYHTEDTLNETILNKEEVEVRSPSRSPVTDSVEENSSEEDDYVVDETKSPDLADEAKFDGDSFSADFYDSLAEIEEQVKFDGHTTVTVNLPTTVKPVDDFEPSSGIIENESADTSIKEIDSFAIATGTQISDSEILTSRKPEPSKGTQRPFKRKSSVPVASTTPLVEATTVSAEIPEKELTATSKPCMLKPNVSDGNAEVEPYEVVSEEPKSTTPDIKVPTVNLDSQRHTKPTRQSSTRKPQRKPSPVRRKPVSEATSSRLPETQRVRPQGSNPRPKPKPQVRPNYQSPSSIHSESDRLHSTRPVANHNSSNKRKPTPKPQSSLPIEKVPVLKSNETDSDNSMKPILQNLQQLMSNLHQVLSNHQRPATIGGSVESLKPAATSHVLDSKIDTASKNNAVQNVTFSDNIKLSELQTQKQTAQIPDAVQSQETSTQDPSASHLSSDVASERDRSKPSKVKATTSEEKIEEPINKKIPNQGQEEEDTKPESQTQNESILQPTYGSQNLPFVQQHYMGNPSIQGIYTSHILPNQQMVQSMLQSGINPQFHIFPQFPYQSNHAGLQAIGFMHQPQIGNIPYQSNIQQHHPASSIIHSSPAVINSHASPLGSQPNVLNSQQGSYYPSLQQPSFISNVSPLQHEQYNQAQQLQQILKTNVPIPPSLQQQLNAGTQTLGILQNFINQVNNPLLPQQAVQSQISHIQQSSAAASEAEPSNQVILHSQNDSNSLSHQQKETQASQQQETSEPSNVTLSVQQQYFNDQTINHHASNRNKTEDINENVTQPQEQLPQQQMETSLQGQQFLNESSSHVSLNQQDNIESHFPEVAQEAVNQTETNASISSQPFMMPPFPHFSNSSAVNENKLSVAYEIQSEEQTNITVASPEATFEFHQFNHHVPSQFPSQGEQSSESQSEDKVPSIHIQNFNQPLQIQSHHQYPTNGSFSQVSSVLTPLLEQKETSVQKVQNTQQQQHLDRLTIQSQNLQAQLQQMQAQQSQQQSQINLIQSAQQQYMPPSGNQMLKPLTNNHQIADSSSVGHVLPAQTSSVTQSEHHQNANQENLNNVHVTSHFRPFNLTITHFAPHETSNLQNAQYHQETHQDSQNNVHITSHFRPLNISVSSPIQQQSSEAQQQSSEVQQQSSEAQQQSSEAQHVHQAQNVFVSAVRPSPSIGHHVQQPSQQTDMHSQTYLSNDRNQPGETLLNVPPAVAHPTQQQTSISSDGLGAYQPNKENVQDKFSTYQLNINPHDTSYENQQNHHFQFSAENKPLAQQNSHIQLNYPHNIQIVQNHQQEYHNTPLVVQEQNAVQHDVQAANSLLKENEASHVHHAATYPSNSFHQQQNQFLHESVNDKLNIQQINSQQHYISNHNIPLSQENSNHQFVISQTKPLTNQHQEKQPSINIHENLDQQLQTQHSVSSISEIPLGNNQHHQIHSNHYQSQHYLSSHEKPLSVQNIQDQYSSEQTQAFPMQSPQVSNGINKLAAQHHQYQSQMNGISSQQQHQLTQQFANTQDPFHKQEQLEQRYGNRPVSHPQQPEKSNLNDHSIPVLEQNKNIAPEPSYQLQNQHHYIGTINNPSIQPQQQYTSFENQQTYISSLNNPVVQAQQQSNILQNVASNQQQSVNVHTSSQQEQIHQQYLNKDKPLMQQQHQHLTSTNDKPFIPQQSQQHYVGQSHFPSPQAPTSFINAQGSNQEPQQQFLSQTISPAQQVHHQDSSQHKEMHQPLAGHERPLAVNQFYQQTSFQHKPVYEQPQILQQGLSSLDKLTSQQPPAQQQYETAHSKPLVQQHQQSYEEYHNQRLKPALIQQHSTTPGYISSQEHHVQQQFSNSQEKYQNDKIHGNYGIKEGPTSHVQLQNDQVSQDTSAQTIHGISQETPVIHQQFQDSLGSHDAHKNPSLNQPYSDERNRPHSQQYISTERPNILQLQIQQQYGNFYDKVHQLQQAQQQYISSSEKPLSLQQQMEQHNTNNQNRLSVQQQQSYQQVHQVQQQYFNHNIKPLSHQQQIEALHINSQDKLSPQQHQQQINQQYFSSNGNPGFQVQETGQQQFSNLHDVKPSAMQQNTQEQYKQPVQSSIEETLTRPQASEQVYVDNASGHQDQHFISEDNQYINQEQPQFMKEQQFQDNLHQQFADANRPLLQQQHEHVAEHEQQTDVSTDDNLFEQEAHVEQFEKDQHHQMQNDYMHQEQQDDQQYINTNEKPLLQQQTNQQMFDDDKYSALKPLAQVFTAEAQSDKYDVIQEDTMIPIFTSEEEDPIHQVVADLIPEKNDTAEDVSTLSQQSVPPFEQTHLTHSSSIKTRPGPIVRPHFHPVGMQPSSTQSPVVHDLFPVASRPLKRKPAIQQQDFVDQQFFEEDIPQEISAFEDEYEFEEETTPTTTTVTTQKPRPPSVRPVTRTKIKPTRRPPIRYSTTRTTKRPSTTTSKPNLQEQILESFDNHQPDPIDNQELIEEFETTTPKKFLFVRTSTTRRPSTKMPSTTKSQTAFTSLPTVSPTAEAYGMKKYSTAPASLVPSYHCPTPHCNGYNCSLIRGSDGCQKCVCDSPCAPCPQHCVKTKTLSEGRCPICDCTVVPPAAIGSARQCPVIDCDGPNCRKVRNNDGCLTCICDPKCVEPKCDPGCEILRDVPPGQCPGCVCKVTVVQAVVHRQRPCPPISCPGKNCRQTNGPDGCPTCVCEQPSCPPPKCDPGCEIQADVAQGQCPTCICPSFPDEEDDEDDELYCPNLFCADYGCREIPGPAGCPICMCDPICKTPVCEPGCQVVTNKQHGRCPVCICSAPLDADPSAPSNISLQAQPVETIKNVQQPQLQETVTFSGIVEPVVADEDSMQSTLHTTVTVEVQTEPQEVEEEESTTEEPTTSTTTEMTTTTTEEPEPTCPAPVCSGLRCSMEIDSDGCEICKCRYKCPKPKCVGNCYAETNAPAHRCPGCVCPQRPKPKP
ncbi:uncharacterized protein LOC118180825 isoform X2 [Stegodyphus dumicola]|uniref:uncharacterized protein LOC118180825 isoform X2 n=1 Tax=Stegodyphus dumicola TaxID=202533 RepID=UPI0015A80214|nr:uncharacterized protein LOC118180825 isoform X2 [Stegodyphus dumicola]